MHGVVEHAHEYFSMEESVQSSTYRELLRIFGCLQAILCLCEGYSVVFQVDAQNLLGIVNRGSPHLKLNAQVRELIFSGWSTG